MLALSRNRVADQVAVGVENARLFAEARGKAALEERQKLARELHDSVSQALYGIALGTKTALALLDGSPASAAQTLDYVLSLSRRPGTRRCGRSSSSCVPSRWRKKG